MSDDSLIEAVPDLVAFVRRNGIITRHLGGRGVKDAGDRTALDGRSIEDVWGAENGILLRQMLRRALASRERVEGQFTSNAEQFEARIDPKGPDKALCMIRSLGPVQGPGRGSAKGAVIERRDFMQRLRNSVNDASLRERPLAVCLVMLRGLSDIGQLIDFSISESVGTAAMLRLREVATGHAGGAPWYLGQLGEGLLAAVVEGPMSQQELASLVRALCESLEQPVHIGDATFQLSPCAGVARLGKDAKGPQTLLEHARSALLEARRSVSCEVRFFSQTLAMQPLNRLDYERELRQAIHGDELSLRYSLRCDLASGRPVAIQSYLRWQHPLRGDVPPAEFLPIAGGTGLSIQLSRWALRRLRRDLPELRKAAGADLRLSFGPLRHHFACDALAKDLEEFLAPGDLPPEMLELRVAEETLAGLSAPERTLGRLAKTGTRLVIDEFGRGYTSLARLANLPFQGMQVDRSFVIAMSEDPAAQRICRAVVSFAAALGLTAIAPGVDSPRDAQAMLDVGFSEGLGDHCGGVRLDVPRATPVKRQRA